MNGFDFAEAVRSEGRWAKVPMVALSSHATEKDFERGREVGFTDYVAKFDRDAVADLGAIPLGKRCRMNQIVPATTKQGSHEILSTEDHEEFVTMFIEGQMFGIRC